MTQTSESYRENALAALIEAESTTLPNVRARALEVAAKWTAMANQLEWVEEQGRLRLGAVNPRLKVPNE